MLGGSCDAVGLRVPVQIEIAEQTEGRIDLLPSAIDLLLMSGPDLRKTFTVLDPIRRQSSLRPCSGSDGAGSQRMPIGGLRLSPTAPIARRWIPAFAGSSSQYRQLFYLNQTDR